MLWFATGVSTLLYGLTIAAFLTLELVAVAYAGPVGWVAVAFTVVLALMGFGCIVWQSPLEWPGWLGGDDREGRDRVFEKDLHRSESGRQKGEELTRMPTRGPSGQQRPERGKGRRSRGRSASAEHAGGSRQYRQRDEEQDLNDDSRANAAATDINEPGIFGHGGITIYDSRVREGLVMKRYD